MPLAAGLRRCDIRPGERAGEEKLKSDFGAATRTETRGSLASPARLTRRMRCVGGQVADPVHKEACELRRRLTGKPVRFHGRASRNQDDEGVFRSL